MTKQAPEIVLILHNIRSTYNVGSIFRTAEGFGVKQIICSGYTPYPIFNQRPNIFNLKAETDPRLPHIKQKIHKQIAKTALDAQNNVPFIYQTEPNISELKNQGFEIVALEQDSNSVEIYAYQPPQKVALILGEEVDGINQNLLNSADTIIEIPMFGQKESFNVSVAAGIAIYAIKFKNRYM